MSEEISSEPILPDPSSHLESPNPGPSWSGLEIVLALVAALFIWPAAVQFILEASRFFQVVYGEDIMALARADLLQNERSIAVVRAQLWTPILALPFQVATVLYVVAIGSATPARQLGLSSKQIGWNLLLGSVVAILVTPVVLGINYVVELLYRSVLELTVEAHPLVALRPVILPFEWAGLVLAVVVAAPILEELIVRGLLQPWFINRPFGSDLAMGYCLVLAAMKRIGPFGEATWVRLVFLDFGPILFVLLMVPIYLLLRGLFSTRAPAAIFATSLLFAMAHAAVWPSPVPLLILGIVLGWLAYRTGSLVASITLHALFNAVGCVVFVFQ